MTLSSRSCGLSASVSFFGRSSHITQPWAVPPCFPTTSSAPLALLASSQPPHTIVNVCSGTFLPPGVISLYLSLCFTLVHSRASQISPFLLVKIKQSISFPSITPNSLCNSIVIATLASVLQGRWQER